MAKILIVDDDEPFRYFMRALLERVSHTVIEARNGVEGVRGFQREQPDLVIVDLFMPEKDGIETIVELKRIKSSVRVIAISAGAYQGELQMLEVAKRLGALRCMPKAFDGHEFLRTVEACLEPDESNAATDPEI